MNFAVNALRKIQEAKTGPNLARKSQSGSANQPTGGADAPLPRPGRHAWGDETVPRFAIEGLGGTKHWSGRTYLNWSDAAVRPRGSRQGAV